MKGYRDIVGDGGSNVAAQVRAQRRAIDGALTGVRHIVAVGSGKGGVGKSTVTVIMALGLARLGRRVAILDADFNGPTQAQLTGLAETPWIPGDQGLVLPRRGDGVGVLSMGSIWGADQPVTFDSTAVGDEHVWRATRELTVLGQLLAGVDWGELDVLLVDLPPGADRTVHHAEFLGARASFVLVTIPSDLARGVVARSLVALERRPNRVLGYIENMSGYRCPDCDTVGPLFPCDAEPLGVPLLTRLPFDPRLASLCDRGWPVDEVDDALDTEAARSLWAALDLEGDPS